jgi:hypothetical protein
MAILWNTCNRPIEGKYDGKIFCFAPKERKKIYNKLIIDHLVVSMEMYGLVALGTPEGGDDFTKDEEQKQYLIGLKNRWKYCDWVVRNWGAMNKEREGNKMSKAAPTAHEENCVLEAQEILEELNKLDGQKIDKLQAYLEDSKAAQAAKEMEKDPDELVTSGLKTELKNKGKRNVAPSSTDKDASQV